MPALQNGNGAVTVWLRMLFGGMWRGEFDHFKMQVGLPSFVLSTNEWIEKTNATGRTACGSLSKRGKQPRIYQPQRKKEWRTLFGCVCPETGKLIPDVAGKGNIGTFFRFLLSVAQHYKDKKVYLILDNVRFHHTKCLKPFEKIHAQDRTDISVPVFTRFESCGARMVGGVMRKEITHNRWVKSMQQRVHDFE